MTHGAGALELWHNLSAYPEFFQIIIASLWGSNFVGNWFVALQCKAIHNLLNFRSGQLNLWVR